MSTPAEKADAQSGAFYHPQTLWWHRHLVSPTELRELLDTAARFTELREEYRTIVDELERKVEAAIEAEEQKESECAKLRHALAGKEQL